MSTEASTELRLLEDTAARLLAEHFPAARLRAMIADESRYFDGVRDLRVRGGELGWFASLVPDKFGGGSLGPHGIVDATAIARQRGRALAPGPFADIHVAASVITAAGSPAQRESLLPGLAVGTLAVACAFDSALDGPQDPTVGLAESADGVILNGRARPVADAASADTFLVWVTQAGPTRRFLVPAASAGVQVDPLQGLDLTARAAQVTFNHVAVPRSGELVQDRPAGPGPDPDVATGALLVAADSCGAMERLLEMTAEYARTRQAFGRPIGSFQAVKHQLADISMLVQASKAVTEAATEAAAGHHHRDAAEIASIAKAFVSEQSQRVGQGCLQLHGGIGYAWEHDLHLYLRRLAAGGAAYGTARYHRAAIAERHLGPAATVSRAGAGR